MTLLFLSLAKTNYYFQMDAEPKAMENLAYQQDEKTPEEGLYPRVTKL